MKLFKRLHSSGRAQNAPSSFLSAGNKEGGTLSSGSSTLSESSDVLSHSQPAHSLQQNLLLLQRESENHLRTSPLGSSRRQYLSVEVYPVPGAAAGSRPAGGSPSTPAPSPSTPTPSPPTPTPSPSLSLSSSSQMERRPRLSRQEATTFQEPAAEVRIVSSGLDSQQGRQLPLDCLATPARHSRNSLTPSPAEFRRRAPSGPGGSACGRVKPSNTTTPPDSPAPPTEPQHSKQRSAKEGRSSAVASAAAACKQRSGRFSILKLGRKLGFMRSKTSNVSSSSNFSSYCEPGSTCSPPSQMSSVEHSLSQFGVSIDTDATAGAGAQCAAAAEVHLHMNAADAEYRPHSPQSYRISRSFDGGFGPPPTSMSSANAETDAAVTGEKTPVETRRHFFQKKKKFSMSSTFDTMTQRLFVPQPRPLLPITPAESIVSVASSEQQQQQIRISLDSTCNESATDGSAASPPTRAARTPRVPLIRTLDMSSGGESNNGDPEVLVCSVAASAGGSGSVCYAELSIAVPAPDAINVSNASIKRSHSERFADPDPGAAEAAIGIGPRTMTTAAATCHLQANRLGPVAALLHSRSTSAFGAGAGSKACRHAHGDCRTARIERSRSIAEPPCFEALERPADVRATSPVAQYKAYSDARLPEELEGSDDSEEVEDDDFQAAAASDR